MILKIASKFFKNRSILRAKLPFRFSSLFGDGIKNNTNTSSITPPQTPPVNSDPPNTNKNNNDNENKVKISHGLETVAQENGKFEVAESEKYKSPSKYVVFSSTNAILPHIKVEGIFTTGKLTYDDLNHKVAFFMQNEEGRLYRTGIVFETTLNKKFKEHLKSGKPESDKKSSPFSNQIKTDVMSKEKNYRVKMIEYESNQNGIFVKAIKINDKGKNKKLDSMREGLRTTINLITELKNLKFAGKPNLVDESSFQKVVSQNIDEMKYEKLDELLYNMSSILLSCEQFLPEKANLMFQKMLEKRNLLERVNYLNEKLKELRKNMEYHRQVSFIISDPKNELFSKINKFNIASDYVKSVFNLEDRENPQNIKETPGSAQQKIIKGYLEKLPLITDKASKEKVKREIDRLSSMDKQSSDYGKIMTYLDEVFSIPWNKYTTPYWNIPKTNEILDDSIYGLQKVKDRIIEMIAVNKLKGEKKENKGFIILLYGPPGTGKTSVAKAIAKSLKRPHRFISFAGVNDPHFIKGHSRTYLDSQPGVFIKEIIKAQTMNPVLILDEIDKLSTNNFGSDPYYSLMEILNPEENSNFVDHYLDIKVDFSQVIFILTANNILNMLEPLKNRLEIIEIPPYIQQEKLNIAKKYLIPKLNESYKFKHDSIKFSNEDLLQIINGWCYHEGGVRELNRCLDKIYRKFSLQMVRKNIQSLELESSSFELNDENTNHNQILKKLLGPPYFNMDFEERSKKIFVPGTVNVLTVAGFIGEVLTVECVIDLSCPDKKGNFTCSGNLMTVIQESITVSKLNACNFLSDEQIKEISEKNIHIHFTNGAAQKDGPSAGISICTAYLSLALNKPIPANVAMTGELSTTGEVCKIGGLQSKLIAAKSLNIYEVIVPYANLSEALDFPKLLTEGLTLYFVKEYKEIYEMLFTENENRYSKIVTLKSGDLINEIISANDNIIEIK